MADISMEVACLDALLDVLEKRGLLSQAQAITLGTMSIQLLPRPVLQPRVDIGNETEQIQAREELMYASSDGGYNA